MSALAFLSRGGWLAAFFAGLAGILALHTMGAVTLAREVAAVSVVEQADGTLALQSLAGWRAAGSARITVLRNGIPLARAEGSIPQVGQFAVGADGDARVAAEPVPPRYAVARNFQSGWMMVVILVVAAAFAAARAWTTRAQPDQPSPIRWFRLPLRLSLGLAVLALAALAIELHASAVWPFLGFQDKVLENFTPESGKAWVAKIDRKWVQDSTAGLAAGVEVLEDGRPLSLHTNLHQDIRDLGAGRFSLWGKAVIFSTSDNSDPTTNGRSYVLRWPTPVIGYGTFGFAGLIAGGILVLGFVGPLIARPWLAVSLAFVLLTVEAWLIYAPALLHWLVPAVSPDTNSYVELALTLREGNSPVLYMRTLAYPLLLWLLEALNPSMVTVVVTQILFRLAANLLAVYAVYRVRPRLTLLAAFAIAVAWLGGENFAYDTSVMSESMYTSALISAFSCLLLTVDRRGAVAAIGTSFFVALAIMIRPSGLFMIPIVTVLVGLGLFQRWRWPALAGLTMPLAGILLAVSFYNYTIMGRFTVTPWGAANLAGATYMMMEPSDRFSPGVNRAIAAAQDRITPEDRAAVRQGFDLDELHSVFARNYSYSYYIAPHFFYHALGMTHVEPDDYPKIFDVLYPVSMHAIKSNPGMYARFVAAELYIFLTSPVRHTNIYVYGLPGRISELPRLTTAKGIWPVRAFFADGAKDFLAAMPELDGSMGCGVIACADGHKLLLKWHQGWFATSSWVVIGFVVALLALVRLWQSRCRDPLAIFVVCLMAAPFGAGLLVALVELSLIRYSYPTEFTYYLAAALAPGLVIDLFRGRTRP